MYNTLTRFPSDNNEILCLQEKRDLAQSGITINLREINMLMILYTCIWSQIKSIIGRHSKRTCLPKLSSTTFNLEEFSINVGLPNAHDNKILLHT